MEDRAQTGRDQCRLRSRSGEAVYPALAIVASRRIRTVRQARSAPETPGG